MRKLFYFLLLGLSISFSSCKDDVKDEGNGNSTVTEEGGEVSSNGISIYVPHGALNESVDITAKSISNPSQLGNSILPLGMLGGAKFGPSGTQFQKDVEITLPLNEGAVNSENLVCYWSEDSLRWYGVDWADVKGNVAKFKTDHFSTYAVSGLTMSDMESIVKSIDDGCKNGIDEVSVASSVEKIIMNDMNLMNKWTVIDNVYYRNSAVRVSYMYSYGYNEVNGQAVLSYGNETCEKGWEELTDLTISDFESMSVVDRVKGNQISGLSEISKENQELINLLISRKLTTVKPEMVLKAEGKLSKKGDETKVKVKLYCQHTGEKNLYPKVHSISRPDKGVNDYTPDGEYEDFYIEDYESSQTGELPMKNAKIKLTCSDKSALSLSETEIITDANGEAYVTVKALKDDAEAAITAKYEFKGKECSEDDIDVEKSVAFESGQGWDVTIEVNEERVEETTGTEYKFKYRLHFIFYPNEELADEPTVEVEILENPTLSRSEYRDEPLICTYSNPTVNESLKEKVCNVSVKDGIAALLFDITNPIVEFHEVIKYTEDGHTEVLYDSDVDFYLPVYVFPYEEGVFDLSLWSGSGVPQNIGNNAYIYNLSYSIGILFEPTFSGKVTVKKVN